MSGNEGWHETYDAKEYTCETEDVFPDVVERIHESEWKETCITLFGVGLRLAHLGQWSLMDC